jgi:hypothetical protein
MKVAVTRIRRIGALAAGLFCAAAAGAAPGASAPRTLPAASAPQWGVASTPASAPSDDADDLATGEYFHDFAALMVRLRSVGWLADICSEAFPAYAELEHRAYDDWLRAHRGFVDEMDGQFALIDRRWAAAAPAAASQGITTAALQEKLNANRAALRDDFLARSLAVQRKRCEAYPTLLLSRPLDIEHAQADLVRSVRRGPPAP